MLISNQLKKNTLWSIIDLGIYPLLMIVAAPIFIKRLGEEQYGLWMLAVTINQLMNVLNFGIADTTIKRISINRASQNQQAIIKAVQDGWSMALFICLFCATIGCIISFSGIIEHWFHIPFELEKIAWIVLCFAFISTATKFCEVLLLSVFKGYERFDISAKLSFLSRSSVLIVNVILTLSGFPLSIIFLSTVVLNIMNVVIQLITLKYKFPFLKFGFKPVFNFNFKNKEQFWYWSQSVIGLVGFLSDRILVGYLTNLKTLGFYSIASLIGSQIHNALTALGIFMFPKVAYERTLKNNTLPIYYRSRFVIAALGWLGIFVLLLTGDHVFKLWLGEDKFMKSINFINLYLVYTGFLLLNIVPYQFINATDKISYNSLIEISLRVSHIVSMLIGFYLIGVDGVLWGLIISTMLNILFQYYLFHTKFLNIKSFTSSLVIIIPAFSFVLIFLFPSLWVKCCASLFLFLTVYFFYFKPTGIKLGSSTIN